MFRACASGEYTSLSQESLNHALVTKTSFRVQECFYPALVVNTLEELQSYACSECTSLLVSRMLTLVLNIQAFALEMFQTGLVMNLHAYPISRVFSDMHLWYNQVLRFKSVSIQCGKKKRSKQSNPPSVMRPCMSSTTPNAHAYCHTHGTFCNPNHLDMAPSTTQTVTSCTTRCSSETQAQRANADSRGDLRSVSCGYPTSDHVPQVSDKFIAYTGGTDLAILLNKDTFEPKAAVFVITKASSSKDTWVYGSSSGSWTPAAPFPFQHLHRHVLLRPHPQCCDNGYTHT